MRIPTQTDVRTAFDNGLPELAPPRRVVVIGAGVAGLATAYELARRGTEVTVLEAADRAGGRARTLREPFADGLYAEAGAMTVSPHCHYTLHYIRELGVDLAPSDLLDTTFSYYLRGRFATPDGTSLARLGLSLNPAEEGMDVAQLMDTYVQSLCRELQPDLDAANWEVTERLALYDRRSVAEVLRDRGASEAAIGLLDPFFLEMRGGDLQSASALSWLRYESSGHSMIKAGTSWSKIKGGTDRLPAAFADRLKGHIHYRSSVVRVQQDDDGARVTAAAQGGLRTFEADRVVVTVPFSAIRHIDFSDARLSRAKSAAMRQLRYASVVRVYLQMRRQFWKGFRVSISTDLPIRWIRDATPDQAGPRKIVECMMTGQRARAVAAMSEEERLRFTLDHLETFLPGANEHFETGTSVVWDRAPHIEGAYILPEPHHAELMPAVRAPEGRIHFAGEHTSFEPNGGAMTFAFESAARALLELGLAEATAQP
ncbi:flavin monoamine oxidase family protein [Streptomyces anulatus]|uniref:flavin monoamine oxidase family protein n=1 Tax=Streptomyces anulatus TaxID=1892 RepID=UPI0038658323|nr:FAD-dependent oxidoreductase [Streptomyces anulatus]WSU27691.1 FAD-dependent oxidoreductase [Streptomyces anulatus]WSU93413.1 FAD-dependent oxidoreductase [Streptomyces anulatus]